MPKSRKLNPIERADLKLAHKVALEEESATGRLVGKFAELGDQPPMRLLCGATIAAGAARGDRRLFRAGLRMLAAHSLATMAKAFVKDAVDRARPGDAKVRKEYRVKPGRSTAHRLQSMPSGHSAGVVAVAAAALADYPAVAAPALAGSVAVVGAQLPSRNHFLSDVAVGSAIGLAAFGLTYLLLPPLESESGSSASAALRSSTRSIFSHGNRSPSALRPKWP